MPENTVIEESKTAPIRLPYVKSKAETEFLTLESVAPIFDTVYEFMLYFIDRQIQMSCS